MRIALTALQQRLFLTGTGRYISELYGALALAEPDWEWLLYLKAGQAALYPRPNAAARHRILEGCPDSPTKRIAWEMLHMAGTVRRDGVDLFHGPSNFLPVVKACPSVLTLHDMFYFRNPERTSWLRSRYWQWANRRSARLADLILTDSEHSKREILQFLPLPESRVRVVYLGVSESFHARAPEALRSEMRRALGLERPYVLFVGRLDPDKNQRGLIHAFAQLAEGPLRGRLLVFSGARDYRSSELPTLARQLGIEEQTRFLGYVEEKYLGALYQECEVFCYPSFNEGFGLPPLEAMASGAPTVTSNVSSLPEVVGNAAVMVDPESPKDIARGLAEALVPARAAELRMAGPEQAQRFTWERCAQETLQAYREVLDTAGRAGA